MFLQCAAAAAARYHCQQPTSKKQPKKWTHNAKTTHKGKLRATKRGKMDAAKNSRQNVRAKDKPRIARDMNENNRDGRWEKCEHIFFLCRIN